MTLQLSELKVLGISLSPAEVAAEIYRKTNPWTYAGVLRYYWPFDDNPGTFFQDYALNHRDAIYVGTAGEARREKTIANVVWVGQEPPQPLCEPQEVFDSSSRQCSSGEKALMFQRGEDLLDRHQVQQPGAELHRRAVGQGPQERVDVPGGHALFMLLHRAGVQRLPQCHLPASG